MFSRVTYSIFPAANISPDFSDIECELSVEGWL